jgi:CRP-like cAMP-binding protein
LKTAQFLRNRRGAQLSPAERDLLERALGPAVIVPARQIVVEKGLPVGFSTFLMAGFMARYMDDRAGHRQLVALHVPGEFVDLHAFPLQVLDHDLGTLSDVTIATVGHDRLTAITEQAPHLARMLWFSTLLDAAMHREWIFRLGRLSGAGRVAHFLCETWYRLDAVGLADGHAFRLPLTQSDLGEACGLTNVHVSRVLSRLRRQGLVDATDGVVRIGDFPALARLGEFEPDYLFIADRLVVP